jgi:hypothetical protein
MSIVESWNSETIYGVTVKSETYYVIRDKETHEFDCREGELTDNIMEANWYQFYSEVREILTHFDEPDKFEIIRFNCTTKLEEIM